MDDAREARLFRQGLGSLAWLMDHSWDDAKRKEDSEYDAFDKKDDQHSRNGAYQYIPLNTGCFVDQMFLSIRVREVLDGEPYFKQSIYQTNFLDVGCGIGTKVFVARALKMQACGIEIRPNLVAEARKRMGFYASFRWNGSYRHPIMEADALKFKHYGRFHIVYYYRPLCDDKKQAKLERAIWEQLRPGSILLPNMPDKQPPCGDFVAITKLTTLFLRKPRSKKTKLRWYDMLAKEGFDVRDKYSSKRSFSHI